MKVLINQQQIAFALNIVSKAINSNNTLPILNNILLEAKEDQLFCSATNLEIAIKLSVKAVVQEEGSLTIPAKLISSYISLLPNEDLEITTAEDLSLEIKSKKSKTSIKGLKADEYPTFPEIKSDTHIFIPSEKLEKAINETAFSAAINTARPYLSGISISGQEKNLTLVATNTHRLAEKTITLSKDIPNEMKAIIPAKTMQELAKILSSVDKTEVECIVSKNQILFMIDGIQLTSRLIDGVFPDYRKIIPTEYLTTTKIKASELSLALKRIMLFAKEVNNSIHLDFDPEAKTMTISTDQTRVGEEKTKLDIEITGEVNKISLNSQYLLDVLSIKESEKIVLEISEKGEPVKITPEKADDYLYIIMPLKV